MSEYWSATSGTALVFQKEEVRDFFTRYLLEKISRRILVTSVVS